MQKQNVSIILKSGGALNLYIEVSDGVDTRKKILESAEAAKSKGRMLSIEDMRKWKFSIDPHDISAICIVPADE